MRSEPVKKAPREGAGKAGDHEQHGIAEDVAIEHLALAQALGPRRHHILLADFVEERILGQQRHGGKAADAQRDQRQHQMPGIVADLAERAIRLSKLSEVRPRSGNQREIAAAGEDSTISRMARMKLGMA